MINRPYPSEELRRIINHNAKIKDGRGVSVSDKQRNLMRFLLDRVFEGDTDRRHTATFYIFGQESTKDLSPGQVLALLDWLKPQRTPEGGYEPDPMAIREAQALVLAAYKSEGQMSLL